MSSTNEPVDPRELVVRSATIYNDGGRTRVPDAIREKMGISKGDKLKFIVEDGEMFVFIERQD